MDKNLRMNVYFSEIYEKSYTPQAELNKLNESKANWTPIDQQNTYKYLKSNAHVEYFNDVKNPTPYYKFHTKNILDLTKIRKRCSKSHLWVVQNFCCQSKSKLPICLHSRKGY